MPREAARRLRVSAGAAVGLHPADEQTRHRVRLREPARRRARLVGWAACHQRDRAATRGGSAVAAAGPASVAQGDGGSGTPAFFVANLASGFFVYATVVLGQETRLIRRCSTAGRVISTTWPFGSRRFFLALLFFFLLGQLCGLSSEDSSDSMAMGVSVRLPWPPERPASSAAVRSAGAKAAEQQEQAEHQPVREQRQPGDTRRAGAASGMASASQQVLLWRTIANPGCRSGRRSGKRLRWAPGDRDTLGPHVCQRRY